MWVRSQAEVNQKGVRSEIDVKPKWDRCEIDVRSKWHRSETEVKSKWNRSEIEARSKRSRSEHELESKWHRSEIEMRWRWKVKPEWNWRGIEVISAQHWIEVKPRTPLPHKPPYQPLGWSYGIQTFGDFIESIFINFWSASSICHLFKISEFQSLQTFWFLAKCALY